MKTEFKPAQISTFDFKDAPVRVVDLEGSPWFFAADVCRVMDLGNTAEAIRGLDDDEKAGVSITDTSSNGVTQGRTVNVINESGLYSLILRSRKPEAKAFKRWVTHEVLPAIRKTGRYESRANAASDPSRFESGHAVAAAWTGADLIAYLDYSRFSEMDRRISLLEKAAGALPKREPNWVKDRATCAFLLQMSTRKLKEFELHPANPGFDRKTGQYDLNAWKEWLYNR